MNDNPVIDGISDFLGAATWTFLWGLILALIALGENEPAIYKESRTFSADSLFSAALGSTIAIAVLYWLTGKSYPKQAIRLCGGATGALVLLLVHFSFLRILP